MDIALRLGARMIWLPTTDAAGRVAACGATGTYPAQSGAPRSDPPIDVLEPDGTPRRGTRPSDSRQAAACSSSPT